MYIKNWQFIVTHYVICVKFFIKFYLHFITIMVYITYDIAKSFHEEVISCIRFIVYYFLYLFYSSYLHHNVISTKRKSEVQTPRFFSWHFSCIRFTELSLYTYIIFSHFNSVNISLNFLFFSLNSTKLCDKI